MAINKITDYIYDIAVKVQENYKKYRIVGDENMESRIILVECVRKTLEKAFEMVGIVPIEKIWGKHMIVILYWINMKLKYNNIKTVDVVIQWYKYI